MDIIFLAAIAIYIFFKLRNELGKVDEDQKRDAIKNFIKEQANATQNTNINPSVVAIPGVGIIETAEVLAIDEKSQKILNDLNNILRKDLEMVLEKTALSAANFMSGANKAFEMVIEAFAAGNIEVLKPLLSEKIFGQFENEIKARQSQNQILNTKILSIKESKIIAAKMVQNYANISVKFVSEQINYVTDNTGTIIDGSKEEVNEIIDIWSFRKDYKSPNPNWFIFSTEN